ncbi:MAG: hypothetical protein OXM61_21360 [Candidatus Poribacteria bacterium]|nr:hypothetical protein [Candidatus Poribacteria bacterium]
MKTIIFTFSVCFILMVTGIFIWIFSRQNDMPLPMTVIEESSDDVKVSTGVENSVMRIKSDVPQSHRRTENIPQTTYASHLASHKISIDDFLQMTEEERWALEDEMTPEELFRLTTQISDDDLIQLLENDISVAKERGYDKEYIHELETELQESTLLMSLNAHLQKLLDRVSTEELSLDAQNLLNEEIDQLMMEIHSHTQRLGVLDKATASRMKKLSRQAETFLKDIENKHREQPLQLKSDAEYQQQQEAFEADLAQLKSTIIEAFSDIAHIEEIDGRLEVISWYPKETPLDTASVSVNSQEQQGRSASPSSNVPYDPVRSLTTAQQNLEPWRAELDVDYFDVVVSQSLHAEELDKFFPTEQERENLKSRTSEMQRAVVSKIREVVSEIPNATKAQKSKLARELVTANFDKDFADAVLSELKKDAE